MNTSHPGIQLIEEGIRTAFNNSPYKIETYREYLDTIYFPDAADQQAFRAFYIRKYQNRKPDVIITVGPSPLRFMSEMHQAAFPGVPIVFCLPHWVPGTLTLDQDFTGAENDVAAVETVEAAIHLQPGTKHVVVVGGSAFIDKQLEEVTKKQLSALNENLDISYLTGLAMPDLLERLKRLPKQTIVLLMSFSRDPTGTKFIAGAEAGPMIVAAANAPVFSMHDTSINHGEVGGKLSYLRKQGRIAGDMVLRILGGEKPQNIPWSHAGTTYIFDSRALKRWGFKEANLPPGSIILNRVPTVWEFYKGYVVGGIALILLETLLIVGLLWQRRRRRELETELVISSERLHRAVEAGKSVGWDWDAKTGINRWFGDLHTFFGIEADTYSGMAGDFERTVYPEDWEGVQQAIADARQNRKAYTAEFRVVRTDGTMRWVSARGQFHYTDNGDPARMLGMAVDITERKLAEEVRFRHAAIVESSADAILSTSPARVILTWNAGAERLFGYTKAEAIGQPIEILLPADLGEEEKCLLERLRHGECIEQYETTRITKAGKRIEVSLTISEIKDNAGATVGYAKIVRDISERHRVESELRESEQRFSLVANTAPVMIWMSGPDKLCNYFNQPWLDFTGRPQEAELGNGWADGVHPEDLKSCLETYTRAFDLREPFKMQYRLRRHDGEYRWLLDIGVPRLNAHGSFVGYIGSCLDVTEAKLAEEALAGMGRKLIEAHEEERTWIARELHDDINQRIALLSVELEQWSQHFPASEADAHSHMSHLRQRLFDLGKDIQALSHRLHSSKLDYLGIASAANSFCKELSEQQKVQIDFRHAGIPGSLPKEVSLCLFRVLQESLQNAAKHSAVRHFNVDLHGTAEYIQLTVTDLGVGFDPQDAINRRGLGLISMRERLQLVSGELSIQSQPGSGTTVVARVPLVAKADPVRVAG